MTALLQLWSNPLTFLAAIQCRRRRAAHCHAQPLCKGVLSPAKLCGPTSDTPCRAPRLLGIMPTAREEPEPLPPLLRQQEWLSRPEVPSIDKLLLALCTKSPPPFLAALPLPSWLQAPFRPPVLSHGEARPPTITRAIHPGSRGPHADCRLLQSITITEHNCPIGQTPLTTPEVALEHSSFINGWQRFFRNAASRVFTGQGLS